MSNPSFDTSQLQPTLRVNYSHGIMQHNTFALNATGYAVHILYNAIMALIDNLIYEYYGNGQFFRC